MTIDGGTVGVGENSVVTINTWGTGVTNISLSSTIFADGGHKTLVANCSFLGNVHFEATPQPTDVLCIAGSTLNGPCGEGTIHGWFTLETPDGEPMIILSKET